MLLLPPQDLIDTYYAACSDGEDTNSNGEIEEWNIAAAPQVKLAAEQCGCAAGWRPEASASVWLLLATAACYLR